MPYENVLHNYAIDESSEEEERPLDPGIMPTDGYVNLRELMDELKERWEISLASNIYN